MSLKCSISNPLSSLTSSRGYQINSLLISSPPLSGAPISCSSKKMEEENYQHWKKKLLWHFNEEEVNAFEFDQDHQDYEWDDNGHLYWYSTDNDQEEFDEVFFNDPVTLSELLDVNPESIPASMDLSPAHSDGGASLFAGASGPAHLGAEGRGQRRG